ncbi:MAG: hypothetical protein AB9869_21140 [Verrucomicrobiia bacterium]
MNKPHCLAMPGVFVDPVAELSHDPYSGPTAQDLTNQGKQLF